MIDKPDQRRKIFKANGGKKLKKKSKKINETIYLPMGNEDLEENFSSSDTELISYLDSEGDLICHKKYEQVSKNKEVSGNSAYRLSNFILNGKVKTPNNAILASVSNSFMHINKMHSSFSTRNNIYNGRKASDSHNTSDIRNDNSKKMSKSVYGVRLPEYILGNRQRWIDSPDRKFLTSNNTNNATLMHTNISEDCHDNRNFIKSELILHGDQKFYRKKNKTGGSKIIQEHGNEISQVGGIIDLTPRMKYKMNFLRKEKLSEIVLIQSEWRSKAVRKRRKILQRIIRKMPRMIRRLKS